VPLNLPAHGHTYRVNDHSNRPVDEGILIVHTYYEYTRERLDCYPIRDGKAVLPRTTDVRVMRLEMFGYISWYVPSYFVFFLNGHHAHVYPVSPGQTYWSGFFSPLINVDRHIYGLKPRPEVLRMFPATAHEENAMLSTIERGVATYSIVADNDRKDGREPSRAKKHNEEQARRIMQYIQRRRTALAQQATRPATAEAPPAYAAPIPSSRSVGRFGLSPREKAFRALEACDYATLRRELAWGLNPNSYDVAPWTLLNRAIALGDLKAVRILVDSGADVNRKLPEHADAWFSFYHGNAAYHAKLRLEVEGYSPLLLAAAGGQLEILRYLQSKGAKVIGPGTGYTLMHAAADKFCDMQKDDGAGRRAVMAHLLAEDHDVNAVYKPSCGYPGGSPLDLARDHHKPLTAQFLKDHGGKFTRATRWPPDPAGSE